MRMQLAFNDASSPSYNPKNQTIDARPGHVNALVFGIEEFSLVSYSQGSTRLEKLETFRND